MKNNLDFSKYKKALLEAKRLDIPEGYFTAKELSEYIKFKSPKRLRLTLSMCAKEGKIPFITRSHDKRTNGTESKFYSIVDVCKLFKIKV